MTLNFLLFVRLIKQLHFKSKPMLPEYALTVTLSQKGRPTAFFSRIFINEQNHSAVEKNAAAMIEAVSKWKHYLTGQHFAFITDQRSVSYV